MVAARRVTALEHEEAVAVRAKILIMPSAAPANSWLAAEKAKGGDAGRNQHAAWEPRLHADTGIPNPSSRTT